MMNRIEARLAQLKAENKKAMITYITAGLPSLEKTVSIVKAQAEAGVDVVELGVPFSDPIADGPTIQEASYLSILNGTTISGVFDTMQAIRKECEVPIVFMMYFNTINHYGIECFIDKCIETGVDGLIVPDLPYEEQGQVRKYLDKENAPILIQLVSPVSKERIPMLLSDARGFVYCVSQMGVTGKGADFHKDIQEYLDSVKKVSKIPVMMGFGISKAEDVLALRDSLDGAIVGSAFIRLMRGSNFDEKAAQEYVSTFKRELNAN